MRATVLLALPAICIAMYDVILPPNRCSPPAECAHGCALWSDLAGDGNTRDQADVDAKFRNGTAPSVRACAMPAYDPGESGPGWCYCRSAGDSSWGSCLDPADASTPEQINLQWVSDAAVTIAFVTVDGGARGTPTATVATSPSLAGGRTLAGVTNTWTQDAADPREYSFHFVPVDGLAPNTTYFYRVSAGAGAATPSAVYSFTTRDVAQPLRFVFFGDMGAYGHNNMDLLAREDVAFLVHGGDHAYQLSSDGGQRGDMYMLAWEGVLTAKPWLTVMGVRASARLRTLPGPH